MVCFQTKNPDLGKFLEGLRMENAGIFNGHLEYFTVIWLMLWPFDNVVVIWYIFHRFGKLCREKSGNPGLHLTCAFRFV
jgi:predicted tellurium resistance membrane protein TerC